MAPKGALNLVHLLDFGVQANAYKRLAALAFEDVLM
jgi:hypothetical protein